MSQVESPLGTLIESAARHEWLSWTKMADVERAAPPVLVGGDGPYVIESDGTRLLDAMSGLFTTQIGYSHGAELGAAAAAQMERLAYYPNWAATNPATLELTERILALAPPQMSRIFFTSGGSESVESAWKLARQHFQARGESTRRIVISRNGSYHGCSLGALSITGIPAARAPFEPLLGRHAPRHQHRSAPEPRRRSAGRRGRVRGGHPRRGPGERRAWSSSSPCRTRAAASCRRRATRSACARSATATASCCAATRSSARSGASGTGSDRRASASSPT